MQACDSRHHAATTVTTVPLLNHTVIQRWACNAKYPVDREKKRGQDSFSDNTEVV